MGAHRIDRVEGGVVKWQRADVGNGGTQRGRCRERALRLDQNRLGDVDTHGPIGFQDPQTIERRKVPGEQSPLIRRVIPGRRGTRQIRKSVADTNPEAAVRGSRSHRGSLRALQDHVPNANDRRRGS